MREPSAAGLFYPKEKDDLIRAIKDSFSHVSGHARPKEEKYAKGYIIPHASYVFSGACAAHAFRQIKMSDAKTFIILGFNHNGYYDDDITISKEDWKTPLGIAKNNITLGEEIARYTEGSFDERSHSMEHSIEVILPMLQYVKKEFSFVPINVSRRCDFTKVGARIAKIIRTRKCIVIASSDFTHYGKNFGYTPFDEFSGISGLDDKKKDNEEIKNKIKKLDAGAIKHIISLDPKGFKEYITKTGATICGTSTINLIIEMMKNIGAIKAELLSYYTSADITHDTDISVSYACISFFK